MNNSNRACEFSFFFALPRVAALLFGICSIVFLPQSNADEIDHLPADPYNYYRKKKENTLQQLESCAWLVTYRKKVYDLSPLSRKSLSKALEGDIRNVLRRVPAAAEHLEKVEYYRRASRFHTILASLAATGLVATRIIHSGASENSRDDSIYTAMTFTTIGLFAYSAYSGWQNNRSLKQELAKSMEKFNMESADPIEPFEGGL